MAIYMPGPRTRRGKLVLARRNAVATLNLTAMVDMFTVLVVFLLQNYASTNQILPLPESVDLPSAATVKELKPSNVVVISKEGIMVNETRVANFEALQMSEDWMVAPLREAVEKVINDGERKKRSLGDTLRDAVSEAKFGEAGKKKDEVDEFRKITIQADKELDFLSIKKIMFTVTEAGIYEINFAVIKKADTKVN